MSDEIKNSEKKSKSIMRSSKAVKYSRNLMFVAGAMGVTTGVLLANTVKAEPNNFPMQTLFLEMVMEINRKDIHTTDCISEITGK